MIELFPSKEWCSGCSACEQICPRQAITMKPDENGFLYPEIDYGKCVECGLCKGVCDFQRREDGIRTDSGFKAFAAKSKSFKERKSSQSGGVAAVLASYILKQGGVVYGAVFDSEFRVVHEKIHSLDQSFRLKGSKYVQSDLGSVFGEIKRDLGAGTPVLFTGTPCQVAGLKKFLKNGNHRDLLYTCDIICHGVPSPKMWLDYIGYIEHRLKYKVILPNLRDKSEGWLASGHQESFLLANMEKCKYTFYANLFYQHFLRPACGNCKYANLDRCGDITVGDCWGIEKEYPSFNDGDAGVNLVLVNSLGGQRLFDSVSKSLDVMNIQNENWWIQPNLLRPSTLSPNYDAFWDEYRKYGFRYVLRKYVFVKQKQEKIKLFIWNALKVVRLEKLFQRLYHGFLR